jgi:tripartite-type tricarboxylate transporter receptor subunit TctC
MKLARLLLPIAMAMAPLLAHAQAYPTHPIRVIVPFTAGSATDILARTVGQKLSEKYGQSVLIENRPGAGGSIGAALVAKAPPDGYTLLLGTASTFGTNSATMPKLSYDAVHDFTPVVMMASTPYLLLAHPSVPANNAKEFVAYAKANPGKLNYGSFGNGSSNQLAYELFKQVAGIEVVHVPYKGGAPLITALLAGEVQSSLDVYATANPHIKAGKFKLLGVASAKRFSLLPETPTLTEQGYRVEGGTFFAILGPARMPRHVVDTLNHETNRALQMPDVRERLTALGAEIVGGTPEALATTIQRDVQKWSKLVKDRNLKFE